MGERCIYKIQGNSKLFTNNPDKGQIQRQVHQQGKDQNTEIAITESKAQAQALTNIKADKM